MSEINCACIRPNEHKDISLYVPREEDLELKDVINGYLDLKISHRCLLVKGERGIGKSICIRHMLSVLQIRNDFFPVIVEADQCFSENRLITKIAESFLSSIKEYFPENENLLAEATHLSETIYRDEISHSELNSMAKSIECKGSVNYGFLDFINLRIGASGSYSKGGEIDNSFKMILTNERKIEILADMFNNVSKRLKREPLLFIDNLDQITEKERIELFLKNLREFDDIPLIISIRNEFSNSDVLKEFRDIRIIRELSPSQLLHILKKRIESYHGKNFTIEDGFAQLSKNFSEVTENPWAFLKWTEFLCVIKKKKGEEKNFLENFSSKYIRENHEIVLEAFRGGTDKPILIEIAKWFIANENQNEKRRFIQRNEIIKYFNLNDGYVDLLEEDEVIVPLDVKLEPQMQFYRLSPKLQFLKLSR